MLTIISRRFIRPDCIGTFEALAAELARASRAEEGCLGYSVNRSTEDRRLHVFVERWRDQAAFEAHGATEHFRRIVPQFTALTEDRPPVEKLEELEV